MSFEDFQDGHQGGHLRYQYRKLLAILNLQVAPMTPTKFQLSRIYYLGEDAVWRFSKWLPRLPYWLMEQDVLTILNLHVTLMLPTKFHLNLTYGLRDVVWKILRLPLWQPFWISEWNDFSSSENPCELPQYGMIHMRWQVRVSGN